jgi:hypothetical protein
MKLPRFAGFVFIIFSGITLLALPAALAQNKASQGGSAENLLAQLSTAFSGDQVVQRVQISGNATWYAGSLEDAGTVTLTASTDGSSQMQLMLASTGQRTETQTGVGMDASCQWAGNDEVLHDVDSGNCRRPALWFFPAFSLQPSLLPSNLLTVDLGTEAVGSGTNLYRHLQGQFVLNGLSGTLATAIRQRSTTDIGLDPATLLPSVLAYSVRPDSGAQVAVTIEIHYSDYRAINGVQIPFLIQRYVNNTLQLEVRVSSAQIN